MRTAARFCVILLAVMLPGCRDEQKTISGRPLAPQAKQTASLLSQALAAGKQKRSFSYQMRGSLVATGYGGNLPKLNQALAELDLSGTWTPGAVSAKGIVRIGSKSYKFTALQTPQTIYLFYRGQWFGRPMKGLVGSPLGLADRLTGIGGVGQALLEPGVLRQASLQPGPILAGQQMDAIELELDPALKQQLAQYLSGLRFRALIGRSDHLLRRVGFSEHGIVTTMPFFTLPSSGGKPIGQKLELSMDLGQWGTARQTITAPASYRPMPERYLVALGFGTARVAKAPPATSSKSQPLPSAKRKSAKKPGFGSAARKQAPAPRPIAVRPSSSFAARFAAPTNSKKAPARFSAKRARELSRAQRKSYPHAPQAGRGKRIPY